jgi:hypothetical protein
MAETIKIEKDIFVRDNFGVRRTVWMAGQEVEPHVYNAILRTNTVVNADDLPVKPNLNSAPTLSTTTIQNKMLPEQEPETPENVPEEKTGKNENGVDEATVEEQEKEVEEVKPKAKTAGRKKSTKKPEKV